MNSASQILLNSKTKKYLLVLFASSFFVINTTAQKNKQTIKSNSPAFSSLKESSGKTNVLFESYKISTSNILLNESVPSTSVKYSYRKFYLLSINASERILLTELRRRQTLLA